MPEPDAVDRTTSRATWAAGEASPLAAGASGDTECGAPLRARPDDWLAAAARAGGEALAKSSICPAARAGTAPAPTAGAGAGAADPPATGRSASAGVRSVRSLASSLAGEAPLDDRDVLVRHDPADGRGGGASGHSLPERMSLRSVTKFVQPTNTCSLAFLRI